MKHRDSFYTKKYKELMKFSREKGVLFPYRNKREFISDWNALSESGVKKVMKTMEYEVQYSTNYKTALAERKVLSELGIKTSLKELKSMTTYDFAAKYDTQIMDMYKQKRSEGLTAKAAGEFISNYWFGSK